MVYPCENTTDPILWFNLIFSWNETHIRNGFIL